MRQLAVLPWLQRTIISYTLPFIIVELHILSKATWIMPLMISHRHLNIRSDFAYAYNDRGSAQRKKGNFVAAVNDYQQAVFLDPSMAFAFNNLGSVRMEMKQHGEAVEFFTTALRLSPEYLPRLTTTGHLPTWNWVGLKKPLSDLNKVIESST
jgi:tetratricopeptide (TPR) repeat protein